MSFSSSSNAYNVPWVEKYHPIKVADAVVNEDAVSRLQVIARNNNMPNLILSGPPRTIKTTTILALMHKLLGGPNCKEAILELNASDESFALEIASGISKMFSQKKVTLSLGRHKIVILDEADRLIELFHHFSLQAFCVLCDLKPATRNGIKSQAMVLAASDGDRTKEPDSVGNAKAHGS
ncbi:replication factor C subunit 2-like [Glycine soja]|uniref:replication factor C subunit 2-like n=1 Tax=Glycine soja TaxID=3848 RepID=UPI00103EF8B5|nr:replication factor C subunit 2-like [Glycine soja]